MFLPAGRQEFRGRSKKDAMKSRELAQAKKTNAGYLRVGVHFIVYGRGYSLDDHLRL